MTSSSIVQAAIVPVAVALVLGLQHQLLLSRSRAADAVQRSLACDVYRASWTSGALGLGMFGIAALVIYVVRSFANPDHVVFLGFYGLAAFFFGLGVHFIATIFRSSVHFLEDRVELREGARVRLARYSELTSVSLVSGYIVCVSRGGERLKFPTVFRGNALILARLRSVSRSRTSDQRERRGSARLPSTVSRPPSLTPERWAQNDQRTKHNGKSDRPGHRRSRLSAYTSSVWLCACRRGPVARVRSLWHSLAVHHRRRVESRAVPLDRLSRMASIQS